MKKIMPLLVAALLTVGSSALGQSTTNVAPSSTPLSQQTPTIASVVDRDISNIEKQILDVGDAMPEGKFNFSPAADR